MTDPYIRKTKTGKPYEACRACHNRYMRERVRTTVKPQVSSAPTVRKHYTPDANDPAVLTAQQERERFLARNPHMKLFLTWKTAS